ncbi:MAG: PEP-CTERM-box response regulator transcription factor [Candidatus Rokuibacteriota bacterium]|nr:MAG: PEP-CTERM-box response regulator transcription factor [Candidatus Rokubacteria bacterium]
MNAAQPRLLIVEDDDAIRMQLKYALRDQYALTFAETRMKALALMNDVRPEIVSLDLGLPPHPDTAEEGLQALEDILKAAPTTKVIVVTGNGDRANARRAVELGAVDYLSKPIDLAEYETVLRRSTYLQNLETENAKQAADAEAAVRFDEIIGSTPRMREIFATVSLVAKTDVTVLVQGESGTGKELVARAVHQKSRRRHAPFVPINCGAIPETLLESELFGHEKGAYTGAHVQRKGKLEQADNGTVFLDEIGEMSLPLQVKLLRFLQERQIERLGGKQLIAVDTRVIAATNKDLKVEIAAGRFREDLYFRLSVVTVPLPPLRERGEDVGMLANVFLRQNCQQYRRRLQFSPEALGAIAQYQWPGNIRELQNAIQRATILARGRAIEPSDLGIPPLAAPPRTSLREARNRVERQVVVDALIRTRGNISRAATELSISRPALHDLLDKHQIDSKELRATAVSG